MWIKKTVRICQKKSVGQFLQRRSFDFSGRGMNTPKLARLPTDLFTNLELPKPVGRQVRCSLEMSIRGFRGS